MTRFALVLSFLAVACGDDGGTIPDPNPTLTGTCDPNTVAISSFDRIDEALTTGLIDLETSIEMKAFAEFNDPRLTAECRGDDTAVFESDSLDLISENWDVLSPNARAILGPFTWPPVYVGSWASPAPRAKRTLEFCDFPDIDPNWAFIPIAGGSFKVWFDPRKPNGGSQAMLVLSALENDIAPKDAGIGMKAPLDDAANTGCNGGDGRLDVFLVSMATYGKTASDFGETKPVMKGAGQQRPTFILLSDSKTDVEIKHAVAHEYFHTIQWAYPLAGTGLRESYDWLKDATAEWNADWVYPSDKQSKIKLPSYLNTVDHTSLDDHADPLHIYGSYIFFKFLGKMDPTLIRTIWETAKMEVDERLTVDKAIPGGFKKQWPAFAKLLWNDDPVKAEADMTFDILPGFPPITANGEVLSGGAAGESVKLMTDARLKHLSIHYYVYFVDPNDLQSRSIAFSSPSDTVGVQAFVKVQGGIREWKDWNSETERPNQQIVHFCTDRAAERLVELVLIVTNSSPTDDNDNLVDLLLPRIDLTSVGCWQYQGTTSVRTVGPNSDSTATSTVTFEVDHSPTFKNDYFLHYIVKDGLGHGAYTADDGFGCHTEKTGNGPLTVGADGGSVDVSLGFDLGVPLPGKRLVSSLDGIATINTLETTSGTCGFSSFSFMDQWPYFEMPVHQILVKEDGSFQLNAIEAEKTFNYMLTPQREP